MISARRLAGQFEKMVRLFSRQLLSYRFPKSGRATALSEASERSFLPRPFQGADERQSMQYVKAIRLRRRG